MKRISLKTGGGGSKEIRVGHTGGLTHLYRWGIDSPLQVGD